MSSAAAIKRSGEDCAARNEDGGSTDPLMDVDRIQSQSPASKNHITSDMIAKTAAKTQTQPFQQKQKRTICQGCKFPPRTCICPSLPSAPLSLLFKKCRIVILRHPHELRRKNSSLPLVELCLFGKGQKQGKEEAQHSNENEEKSTPAEEEEFVMKTIVSRTLGDHCDSAVMKLLRDPNEVILLVFPHEQAMDLEDGIRLAEERCDLIDNADHKKGTENEKRLSNATNSEDERNTRPTKNKKQKKMTLIFIDATWKHAREMETKTDSTGEWPKNLIRVQMTPTACGGKVNVSGTSCQDNNGDNKNHANANFKTQGGDNNGPTFIERRFQIRTPPSPDHLSTAECLAWIASRVEHNPRIYQEVMKTLDFMVEIWKGFTTAADSRSKGGKPRGSRVRGFTDGDGDTVAWDSMSQKKRKIKHTT